ncbi:RagB/SusD family nutrient uptake outer membrane protein [Solitalea sp. MAHUQ-68]|uniref:RagB/SusD family nutrient uptake outer membrane protein n=1 Tax=Solitalea agri TaxID=2953739 RepID=A0A9X2F9F7_9SPHI|nr:RagB/SusD family nutrient uptake outer membrane protein [Solitalea agri]MCO4294243.1 RagB/SusD family nutrient uptake outer membrane protein [Solitalea agri]
MYFANNSIITTKNVLAFILSAGMVLQSCSSNFLDVPPQAKEPAVTFFVSEDDATKAVNSIYANLRVWNQVAFAAIAIESVPSDEAEKGSSPGDATFFNNFDNFTYTASEGQIQDFWTGQYQSINLCNQVIENIPPITMDENLKTRYIAEAKFVRAYNYFRLVRAFGDVPLRLTLPKSSTEFNIPRTPKEQVWAAIEQDLTDAAAVLPTSYPSTDVGRATKGAALALHAKVAMYQKKWNDVLNYTNQVMALGYSLFPNFEQLFRIANENNPESVFEIQCQSLPNIQGASNSQYSQVQGVRAQSGGGWGFNVPTEALVNAFEANDPRRDATIIFRGETTPEGDAVAPTGDNPRYNQKSYVPFTVPFKQNEGEDQNIRVIRFAEVLLMNAEAANELGNTAQALQSLNRVRLRARGGNPNILPDVTTTNQDQLRTAIYHERQVELAMEFDRFFDVVRQGRGVAVLGSKGFKAGKNEVMPIPQNEIDKSAGTLTQNVGYN